MRMDPAQDIFVLEAERDLCGYSLIVREPDIGRGVLTMGVCDGCTANAPGLLEAMIEQARHHGLPAVHVAAVADSREPVNLYRQRGFHEVAEILEMTLLRDEATGMTEESLPAEFRVRPMAESGEIGLLTQVQNTVFEEHWGFSANEPHEIRARLELPGTGPRDVLFVESSRHEIAAYVWTAAEWSDDRTAGRILMTGVMPGFRGAGIGKAVVQAGVKYLLAAGVSAVQLEVTADNESAIAIYNSTGFKPTGKITWLELRLSS